MSCWTNLRKKHLAKIDYLTFENLCRKPLKQQSGLLHVSVHSIIHLTQMAFKYTRDGNWYLTGGLTVTLKENIET